MADGSADATGTMLPPEAPPPATVAPASRRAARAVPVPRSRRLRVFALDPGLAASLDTAKLAVATIAIPYECDRHGRSTLGPGPVGDYLEVVDVDPASDRAYPPVNLDDHRLLATDGLTPSEGNPQFHQQMVYAVGMKTIRSFEDALGRQALWAPHRGVAGNRATYEYVHRLRLYPHALRERNAYYSPQKMALLFGYFPAAADAGSTVMGTMTFACLSADIVAHEMTHALLDGVHRHYQEASNPQVPAFHEGFADIVALFQHFTMTDIVAAQIATARGEIGAARLLGGLAVQFGEAGGRAGALRDYLDPVTGEAKPNQEAHGLGARLVFAVYEAFVSIVERRIGDLVRLATGGSGILPPGELHPALVDRLTRETCKAASQCLRICIRAIDYCPPNDITFGEYLRALITADLDQVADDRLGYRLALIQAFRGHGLLPPRLRTVSEESLAWRTPTEPRPAWLATAVTKFNIDWAVTADRWTSYRVAASRRALLHDHLAGVFRRKGGDVFADALGLDPALGGFGEDFEPLPGKGMSFSVHSLRRARRTRPDGTPANQIIAVIAQRRPERVDPADPDSRRFWFRGGCTLVVDPAPEGHFPASPEIRYSVVKHMLSTTRLDRQRAAMAAPPGGVLRAQYFDTEALAAAEPFAMLHDEFGA